MNNLSSKLKQLREEKGMTQKELSEVLNISTSAYGYYEQGKSFPNLETILLLSEYYNVSIDYLLGKSNYKYCVEALIKKFNLPTHNESSIEKIKLLVYEIIKEINENKFNISEKDLTDLVYKLMDYIEYKLYKIKNKHL